MPTPNPALGPNAAGLPFLQELIVKFISISAGLAFIALVVMITYGGIRFITSGGDAKGVQEAQKIITTAVIGMVLLVAAWLILKLIEAFTGAKVTEFCIGFAPYCVL